MKKAIFTGFIALCTAAPMMAQTLADPVVMTVAGKPISRSEFEYSYNKNGSTEGAVESKTVEEYAEMFLNYKLKVAAAEAAHLDTLSSFRKEFAQYRDMQLMPRLKNEAFIDSVARSIYDRTVDRLAGKDMIRTAHIFLQVPQNASEEESQRTGLRADSIVQALQAGADFAEMAKAVSQDRGTAQNGGELSWIGPGMTPKEFEDAAYALSAGQMSGVVKTSFGYHVIKMLERKQLEPYDEIRDKVFADLRGQGIEDAAAENKLQKMIAQSGGRLTREAVMDSLLREATAESSDIKYLIAEYHDGLLLFEISKQQVWDKAKTDVVALEQQFKKNKSSYVWTEPHFKGFVIEAADAATVKKMQKMLKAKGGTDAWKAELKEFNKGGGKARIYGPYVAKKGDNSHVDKIVFKTAPYVSERYPATGTFGKMQAKPKVYTDVTAEVVRDVQEQMEAAWIAQLRSTIPYSIDHEVLSTVNNH